MSKKGERRPNRMLVDMRAIYNNKMPVHPTPGQEALIKELKEKPGDFLDRMTRFEEAHTKRRLAAKVEGAAGKPSPSAAPDTSEQETVADEGAERSLALIDRLLASKEWRDEA